MKTARLVLGLIGIILALIMFYVGIKDLFLEASLNGFGMTEFANATNYGAIIAPIFLIGAIVMIICNRRGIVGGCIVCTILFLVCGAIGLSGLDNMNFTVGWLIVIAVYLVLSVAGISVYAIVKI